VREDRTNALWQTNYATILDTKGNMLAAAGDCEKALGPLRDGSPFAVRLQREAAMFRAIRPIWR